MKLCSGPCGNSYPTTYYWSDAGAADGRMSRCPTCEKAARAEAARAKAAGERAVQSDRNGRPVAFSDEERKRRSELAKRMHADGRLGATALRRAGGTAVARQRIADAVLDHFRQPDQQELVKRALEGAFKGKNKNLRLAAYRELRVTEEKQDERMRADRGGAVDPSGMTQEELQEFVQQGLQAMIERGEFPADVVLGDDDVQEVE